MDILKNLTNGLGLNRKSLNPINVVHSYTREVDGHWYLSKRVASTMAAVLRAAIRIHAERAQRT